MLEFCLEYEWTGLKWIYKSKIDEIKYMDFVTAESFPFICFFWDPQWCFRYSKFERLKPYHKYSWEAWKFLLKELK